MHSDPTIIGLLGMKGLIDLRVADMLAKQAALQHKAALFQSHIAQHESDKAVLYKNRADSGSNPMASWFSSATKGKLGVAKIPHSSTWYEPSGESILGMGTHSVAARYPNDVPILAKKLISRGLDISTLTVLPQRRVYSDFI